MDESAANRLIDKLQTFASTLEADERVMLGVLIAPGIERAYVASPEVSGFGMVEWTPDTLAASLGTALREAKITVTGLDDRGGSD
jgi:hypothetical protein